jgi:Ca2+-binding RTX toxin-like protein
MAIFTGTNADEVITPDFVSATVTIDGRSRPSNAADLIDGGAGDDVIDGGGGNDAITGGVGNDVLSGGSGSDTVTGGAGFDVAFLGAGNDVFIWNPGDGSDVVAGQGGVDTLQFNGNGANEHMVISADNDGAVLTRDVGTITMDLSSVEHVNVAAAGGADSIVVNDLSGSGVRAVGIDLAVAGSGDGQSDSVTVNGSAGNDRVTVSDKGGSVVVEGLSARVTIDGAEAGNDSLVIKGLDGNDRINAAALDAGHIKLAIDGGVGNDVINGSRGDDVVIGGAGSDTAFLGGGDDVFIWNPGDGSDVVDGQHGVDTLKFVGSDAAEHISISANHREAILLRDPGNVTMALSSVENVQVAAAGGADNIVIDDLAGTSVRNVNIDLAGAAGGGDGQVDTIVINATGGDDAIHVSNSNGVITVTGLATDVTIFNFEAGDRLVINGLGGNDVIDGSELAANVSLIADGGDGDDVLIGGAGNDDLRGGRGDDVLIGGAGVDHLDGGPGSNIVIQSLVVSLDHGLI